MKLSIITINYNNKAGLQKTIDSVICQTWRDFEWIVIDGGSTDGSKELIEQYQQHFAYWCSEPDKGVYNAMNKGIAKAKGEYLNFMNSGDIFAADETLLNISEYLNNWDIVYGFCRDKKTGEITNKMAMTDILELDVLYYNTLPHQACFFRKQLFEKVGLYREDLRIVSDWVFLVQSIVHGGASYKFVPKDICVYEGDGLSSDIIPLIEERQEMMKILFPPILENAIQYILSIKTVRRFRFTKISYSILFRFSCFLSRLFSRVDYY